MKLRYVIVIEKPRQEGGSYAACAPDVPGPMVISDTLGEMREKLREELEAYLGELVRDGEPLPAPSLTLDAARAYAAEPPTKTAIEFWQALGAPMEELYSAPRPIIDTMEINVDTPE